MREQIAFAVLVALLACLGSGCSLAGFTAGKVADGSQPDETTIHPGQLNRLETGDSVTVAYGICDSVRGVFVGFDETLTDTYAKLYRAWHSHNHNTMSLPMLDDSIRVEWASPLRSDVEGTLVGFDPDVIRVRVGNEMKTVNTSSVWKLCGYRGEVLDGKTLRNALHEGKIPFMSTLRVESNADTQHVAISEVKCVRLAKRRHIALSGLLIFGAGVVATMVAALVLDPPQLGLGN